MRFLGFLGLLVLLAVAVLGPGPSESRKVSRRELKDILTKKLHLPRILHKYKNKIIKIVVCEVHRTTRWQTNFTNVLGMRVTRTTKPMTTTTPHPTTTTTTTTATPARDEVGSSSMELGSRRRRDVGLMDNEGSGMSMTMEEIMDREEDKFDREQLMTDDNALDSESSEEDNPGGCPSTSNNWSLGYYGIFRLSDSHFCCSGYRWSRNVCKTDCRAFTDDDISDDVDCLIRTGYWRLLLMTASYKCRPKDYFS